MYYNMVLLVFFLNQLNRHIFMHKMHRGLKLKRFKMWGQQYILIILKKIVIWCVISCICSKESIYRKIPQKIKKWLQLVQSTNQSKFLCFISQLNMEYDLIQVMVSLEQVFEFQESSNLACAFMSCLFVIIRTKRFLRYFPYKRIYP